MRNIYNYCKVLLYSVVFLILMLIPNVSVYAEAEKTSQPQIEYSQPSDDQTIAKGAKGEEVCWIQAALNQVINANLIVDGDFGNNTEAALKTFQTKCGIEADGIANAKTIAELKRQVTGERQETKEVASESTTSTEHTKNVKIKMFINILVKIGIGTAIFLVLLLIISFTTRDVTRISGYSGSIKSGNCSRMFIRSVTLLLAEIDAYLIFQKDTPILKTIGLSLLVYPVVLILLVLLPHSDKGEDIDWANDDTSFILFLVTLLGLSVFSVYFMTSLGWI